ncbi:MAG: hypothetical protein CSA49_00760 [Gammaproteobacteria bacterium]|nr:MAG: hypothetical protein CSA49_00760 [Gammaproteobacteria bacterium]
MKNIWLALALCVLALPAQAVERFIAGEHYLVVGNPGTEIQEKGRVVEFFSYGCPHCEHLEPYLHQWLASKKDSVQFVRVPAQWNAYYKVLARFYLTLNKLGLAEQHSKEVFNYVHMQRKPLLNKSQIRDFAENTLKIPATEFDAAWGSAEVKEKLTEAGQMLRQFKVSGVPALVVNDVYYVSVKLAGSEDALFEVVDFLLQK